MPCFWERASKFYASLAQLITETCDKFDEIELKAKEKLPNVED